MPADMHKLIREKELIISTIKNRGPSLPVHLARATNLSMLFASAYLSELFSESRVKMSSMRVGSSPLYYLDGQEEMLERFIEHLNPKEREAYLSLKESKIIEDETAPPAIRVALRAIKDFAVPIRIKNQDTTKIVWKHFLVKDEELQGILNKSFSKEEIKEEKVFPKDTSEIIAEPLIQKQIEIKQVKSETPVISQVDTQKSEKIIEKRAPRKSSKKEKKTKTMDIEFTNKIKGYLESKNFEVLQITHLKKKECSANVRFDTPLGKQEYFLLTKDKKKISEEDIATAIHKAHSLKMPALLLISGTLDSSAQEYAETWRNLIKIEKTKF